MYIDNSNIQGQGAEGQQSCYYCPGEQCCPTTQGEEVDEGLHDKGLVDTKEHQEENSRPEGVVQVIACYHPDLS